jgi:predicted nucleic acid-binding protein
LIAAAVDIRGDTLLTANAAHYRMIPGLALQVFRPGGA